MIKYEKCVNDLRVDGLLALEVATACFFSWVGIMDNEQCIKYIILSTNKLSNSIYFHNKIIEFKFWFNITWLRYTYTLNLTIIRSIICIGIDQYVS